MNLFSRNNLLIFSIIILAIASRFLPHEVNFSIVTALAIFAGANLGVRKAILLTLLVRFVSDLYLGFFGFELMVAVYASHLLGVGLGKWISVSSRAKVKAVKIFSSGFISGAVFFLVTNFAFFYPQDQYPHNFAGILLAYTNGLPFLRGTLLGDVGYTVVMFSVLALVKFLVSKFSKEQTLAIKS